jgi:methionine synthase II (cobalamin-independent)
VGTGVAGLSADLDKLGPADLDTFAEALDQGRTAALGVVPSTDPAAAVSDARVVERVQRWLDMLGLDPEEVGERLVLTPSCGLAAASGPWAREALQVLRRSASGLSGG